MNALRVAQRARTLSRATAGTSQLRRASTISVVSHTSSVNALPLANVEAQWEKLSKEEQLDVYRQLEELQKRDWKTLSIDEKKAAYYVAFGPHGPRTPTNPPGTSVKIAVSVAGAIAAATVLWTFSRAYAPPPPKTLSKEWQEASNEYAREQNINPIAGVSSKEYKGTGFVQS
ncbi:cytochrome c oxidase subunit IV-domain-containing protein [Cantharellus anzutake]|uniref:cytochrome c oxidase subunit IV-domain-containing protein n=1 Tax=Cantharellus anzutake TaxID=1750568 RepID=UPI001904FFD5|nr:cytochrome c oxidase subunit IV-domain-containing protein [Cantharellus anzutake]KAF8329846.1 cytochrome c oxidase subunit IV-domain-containing protein [Cantharellus anzutake]